MVRSVLPALLAAGLALTSLPALAQNAAPRHARKPAQQAKPAATAPAPSHNINAPSTDFSKVERSEEEAPEGYGGRMRPVMGSGGMGIGGAF